MDPAKVQIEPGAVVQATDGHFGTVAEVIVQPQTGKLVYLTVRRGWNDQLLTVPADLIAAPPGRREVRLRVTREEARAQAAAVPADALLARDSGHELRIPVAEERLVPGTRQVDLGELRLHKRVEQVEETLRHPVSRDDLVIERVPVGRPLEAPLEPRVEGDWLVIPIMEEVLVVQKRLMLAEEVRIRKRRLTVEEEVRDTVRRERVELEDATVYGVNGLRADGTAVRPAATGSEPPEEPPLAARPAEEPAPDEGR